MPIVSDATALVALGEIESIHLLQHVDPLVVVGTWVAERELCRFSEQVHRGVADGWLRIQEPSDTEVRNLIRAASSFELDRGEVESLVVARHREGSPTTVLIDEGEAHLIARNVLIGRGAISHWNLVCLADVLHDLEAIGTIDSAADLMQRLLDGEHYHWAPAVRTVYERRCEQRGITPVPRTMRRPG